MDRRSDGAILYHGAARSSSRRLAPPTAAADWRRRLPPPTGAADCRSRLPPPTAAADCRSDGRRADGATAARRPHANRDNVATRAMIWLPVDLHPQALPLYQRSGLCFPLIRAVIDGLQAGRIWVDRAPDPRSALVVTGFGFTCLLGEEDHQENHQDGQDGAAADGGAGRAAFDSRLRHRLQGEAAEGQLPGYLLWYAPPPSWRAWLDRHPEGAVRRRERVRLRFGAGAPAAPPLDAPPALGQPESVPEGLRVAPLDNELLPAAEPLGLNLTSRFWSSAADLLQHGFGACLVAADGAVVSLCYTSCVADNLAEIDIATREDRRGHGLGAIVAREFIRQCRRRRVVPTWDCFTANQPSLRLAESLGFVETDRYWLYSFRTPLATWPWPSPSSPPPPTV
jgi:GNAT superfamily N-acetyltransferase